jgi:hypothetical protein
MNGKVLHYSYICVWVLAKTTSPPPLSLSLVHIYLNSEVRETGYVDKQHPADVATF